MYLGTGFFGTSNLCQKTAQGFATVASLRRRPKPEAPRLAFVAIKPEADCPGWKSWNATLKLSRQFEIPYHPIKNPCESKLAWKFTKQASEMPIFVRHCLAGFGHGRTKSGRLGKFTPVCICEILKQALLHDQTLKYAIKKRHPLVVGQAWFPPFFSPRREHNLAFQDVLWQVRYSCRTGRWPWRPCPDVLAVDLLWFLVAQEELRAELPELPGSMQAVTFFCHRVISCDYVDCVDVLRI